MANDESDAEYERRYPNKRSGLPVWAIVLLVLGAVGIVGGIGTFVLVKLLFGGNTTPPTNRIVKAITSPPQGQEFFTRAEFETLVTGKTPAEVKAAVGEPTVSAGNDGDETWTYFSRTRNPNTGRANDVTDVVFVGGKVVRVDFRDPTPPPGGPGSPP